MGSCCRKNLRESLTSPRRKVRFGRRNNNTMTRSTTFSFVRGWAACGRHHPHSRSLSLSLSLLSPERRASHSAIHVTNSFLPSTSPSSSFCYAIHLRSSSSPLLLSVLCVLMVDPAFAGENNNLDEYTWLLVVAAFMVRSSIFYRP